MTLGLIVTIGLVSAAFAPRAGAEVIPERPLRVGISPGFRALGGEPAAGRPEAAGDPDRSAAGGDSTAIALERDLQHGVTRFVASRPEQFTLVSELELVGHVEGNALFSGTLALARQWAEMGLDNYKRLETAASIDNLEKALQNYLQIHFELVEPREVAEVLQYLALAYLEDGRDVVRPLELMKMMIRLDPARTILPGYYPEYIVQFYRSAREVLGRELRELNESSAELREAREIARLARVDALVFGFVLERDDSQVDVLLYLYSTAEDAFLAVETLTSDAATPEAMREAGSRLMSRYAACMFEPRAEPAGQVVASQGTSALSLQVQFAYATFLKFPGPIEQSFGNYGVSIGANFLLTREFGLTGAVQVLNSMRDYNGILRDDFTTIRGFAGGQLGLEFGDVHVSLQTALELSHVGPIRALGDKNCIPAPDLLCPNDKGTVIFDQLGTLVGINVRPGIAYRFSRAIEVVASMSMGYYVYPMTERILNFPLTAEMGVQYRF